MAKYFQRNVKVLEKFKEDIKDVDFIVFPNLNVRPSRNTTYNISFANLLEAEILSLLEEKPCTNSLKDLENKIIKRLQPYCKYMNIKYKLDEKSLEILKLVAEKNLLRYEECEYETISNIRKLIERLPKLKNLLKENIYKLSSEQILLAVEFIGDDRIEIIENAPDYHETYEKPHFPFYLITNKKKCSSPLYKYEHTIPAEYTFNPPEIKYNIPERDCIETVDELIVINANSDVVLHRVNLNKIPKNEYPVLVSSLVIDSNYAAKEYSLKIYFQKNLKS